MLDMNIVLSTDEVKFVRRGLEDFKKSCIIDSREIMMTLGYAEFDPISNITHQFIINQEIEKKLEHAINSKRINQIIYFHYSIDQKLIEGIKSFFEQRKIKDARLILFDKDESLVSLWAHFDEIKN